MSDLDEMEQQYQSLQSDVVDDKDEQEEQEQEEERQEDDKSPPGFKSYDEYIKEGGDPKKYRGEDAYKAEYQRIQKEKSLKSELKELKDMVKATMTATEQWKEQKEQEARERIESMRQELEGKLKEQKETMDVDGALDTKSKLSELEKREKELRNPAEPNPIIKQFVSENPILDSNSDQYNKDFFEDVARYHDKEVAALTKFPPNDPRSGSDLTERQLKNCLKLAFNRAKDLNAELFTSPRNSRSGPTRKSGASEDKGVSLDAKVKGYKVNTYNDELNGNAAGEIYQMLKETDPKAAESFAKNLLKE